MAVRIRHADHVAPSICKKLALTLLTSGGRSVGIVRSQTQAMEFLECMLYMCIHTERYVRRWIAGQRERNVCI
jgi:hypothetical protein